MHLRLRLLLCALLVLGSVHAQAGEGLDVNAQVRVRSELDGRDFDSDTPANAVKLLRTRLGITAHPQDDTSLFVQLQDSRFYGQEPGTLANFANLDLHQAFFEITDLWGKPLRLKVGRQEIAYGGQRLIGAVGWHNVGRSFDAVKLTVGQKRAIDILGAVVMESHAPAPVATPANVAGTDDMSNYLFGAYHQKKKDSGYQLGAYAFYQLNKNETVAGEKDLSRFTVGTHNKGRLLDALNFETEVALQVGMRQGQDVFALMLTGAVGYKVPAWKEPTVSVGFDYLSGTDADDEKYGTFDTLFATNHKFYGFMDYFVNIPAHTGGNGLQDLMVKAAVPLAKKWNGSVHLHNFRLAKGDISALGNEVDVTLVYKYSKVASATCGASVFIPGDMMKAKFGGNEDPGFWAYSMLTVNY